MMIMSGQLYSVEKSLTTVKITANA